MLFFLGVFQPFRFSENAVKISELLTADLACKR